MENVWDVANDVQLGYYASVLGKAIGPYCRMRICEEKCSENDCELCPVSKAYEMAKADCSPSASVIERIVKNASNYASIEKATMQFILTISSLCTKLKKYDACGDNECDGVCSTRMELEKALLDNNPTVTDDQLMLFAEMQWTVNGFANDDPEDYVWFEDKNSTCITNPFIDPTGRFPHDMKGAYKEYGKKNVDEWCRKAREYIMNFKDDQSKEA